MQRLEQEKETPNGAFVCEVYREAKEEMEALAKKGVPKIMADYAFFRMLLNDEVYFSSDFSIYSTTRLEGFRTWSQLMEEDLQGYQFIENKLIAVSAPTLNYE